MKPKRSTLGHIIKMTKVKQETTCYIQGELNKTISICFSRNFAGQRESMIHLNCWNFQLKRFHPARLLLRIKRIKITAPLFKLFSFFWDLAQHQFQVKMKCYTAIKLETKYWTYSTQRSEQAYKWKENSQAFLPMFICQNEKKFKAIKHLHTMSSI